jgi:hypothetical protein
VHYTANWPNTFLNHPCLMCTCPELASWLLVVHGKRDFFYWDVETVSTLDP